MDDQTPKRFTDEEIARALRDGGSEATPLTSLTPNGKPVAVYEETTEDVSVEAILSARLTTIEHLLDRVGADLDERALDCCMGHRMQKMRALALCAVLAQKAADLHAIIRRMPYNDE